MKESGFVESISRLIKAAEEASADREEELQSTLSQLHGYSEELHESRKIISTLKDQLHAQELLVRQLFDILSNQVKK